MSHTPLCSKDCNIKHHDVVTSLQAVAPRFNSSGSNDSFPGPVRATRGNNKEDFKKHVQKLVSEGWSKDKEVPEPFQLLKLPLLHLASMFGKHEVVEWLLNEEGYDAKLQASISGETALHLVARHLYTALSPSGSRLENMSITAKVANFERVVSLLIEKEVSLFWAKDEVNRETPFHILAKQLLQASSGFVDGELEKEDLCLSFFSNSLDVTLKLMLAEEKTRLNRRDVKHALSIKNSEGNTALHYLAQAFRHGFLVLRFLVKSLGNNDLLKIKNSSGLSAIDIVNQVYPGHEKDLLIDEEVKKRAYKVVSKSYQNTAGKQMNLLEVLHTSGPNVTSSNSATKSVVGVETATANSCVNRCAIHTQLFPGLCSADCCETMDAVGTLVNTHTPLCPTGCDLRHHLLTSAVFSPSVMFRAYSDHCVPVTFKLCIQACLNAGWERDMIVPDPLSCLQYPLLHLICLSGDCIAAAKVIEEMKFSYSVSHQSKETPLHVAARYFPVAYSDGKFTSSHKIIAKFQGILDLFTNNNNDMLFMADANGDTVLHVLADCFCTTSALISGSRGLSGSHRKTLVTQKRCYFEAIKLFLETIADLIVREKVSKEVIGKFVYDKNNNSRTFLDLLDACPDKVMLQVFSLQARELLPFCFEQSKSQSRSCQIQSFETEEGGCPVQGLVSSPSSLPSAMEVRNTNILQYQPVPPQVIPVESPPLTGVVHNPMSPTRPQAQVQSVQFSGQPALTGNPSQQISAVAPPAQHIPVIFIKDEPLDLQPDAQCFYSVNNQVVGFPQGQKRSIFHPASTVTTIGTNRLSVQATGRGVGQQMLPLVAQSFRVTPVEIVNAHQTPGPTHSTGSGLLQNTQSVDSTSQNLRGSINDASRDHFLLQSMDRNRIENSTIEESLQLNADTSTSYTIDKWHTPMCSSKCIIEHHHLVLTLCGHSNRTNFRKNRFHQSQYTRSNFAHCIRKNLIEGFSKNADVLDGLEKLQLPLVHLAGIFFKYCAIETLSYFGFDLNVLSQKTGDFPLHSVLRHNYEGMKVYKGTTFMNTTYGEKVFTKVLNSLTNGLNAVEVLSQQDRNGDTPFLVAAKCVIDTSVHDTMQQVITASEIPDSTQECGGSNSQMGKSLNNSSGVCNAMKVNKQQHRADFHMGCIGVMIQKLHESSIVNHKVDLTIAKKVLMVKNNCGETFLQVLCKEHHIAAACISKVLSKFPLGILIDCAKECIPESCWPDCVRSQRRSVKQREIANVAYTSGTVHSALETTPTSKRKEDAQPSKPESPRWSSDARMTQPSPTTSTVDSAMDSAPWSYSTPLSATPLHKEELGSVSPLDAMLSPVLANPSQATLRPNTKRKIIDALKEDYSERLELAVKGRNEVEEDILKHKKKTRELTEIMSKKREVMRKMERELQELQKEIWHENQAVQALENSLEQFTKEEDEMQKNLAVLQGVDPEPAAKQSKSSDQESTL